MSNCGCVYVDIDDGAEFFNEKRQRARIEHRCSECSRKILAGEMYERVVGKWNGTFSVYKTCLDCLSMRDVFFCEEYNFGYVWEDLRQHIFNLGGEIASTCISPLTPRSRKMVCDIIEQSWERCCA
jgi:hypothetical protein